MKQRSTLVDRVVDAYLDALDRIWFDARSAVAAPIEIVRWLAERMKDRRCR